MAVPRKRGQKRAKNEEDHEEYEGIERHQCIRGCAQIDKEGGV
jgi:hypothetical protein